MSDPKKRPLASPPAQEDKRDKRFSMGSSITTENLEAALRSILPGLLADQLKPIQEAFTRLDISMNKKMDSLFKDNMFFRSENQRLTGNNECLRIKLEDL